jgi:hypothetical protein
MENRNIEKQKKREHFLETVFCKSFSHAIGMLHSPYLLDNGVVTVICVGVLKAIKIQIHITLFTPIYSVLPCLEHSTLPI